MKIEIKRFYDDCFKEQEIELLVAPGVSIHENVTGQTIVRIYGKIEIIPSTGKELMLKVGTENIEANYG